MSSSLGDVIGRVNDLSCAEGDVRVADKSALTPQPLTGSHNLPQ